MAGVERNPGPTHPWICSVCNQPLHRNITSVKCNSCSSWCHLRRCTNLPSHSSWSTSFIANCCSNSNTSLASFSNASPSHTQRLNPPSNISSQTLHVHNVNITDFKILQFNCNGLSQKLDEILQYIGSNNIFIAAVQETRLTERSNLSSRDNFTILRKDRGKNTGGGLAFILHNSVKYQTVTLPIPGNQDKFLEQQGIIIKSGSSQITLVNLYIPPPSSCEPGYKANIEHLLNLENSIILGDFNAHHDLWDHHLNNDQRGEDIVDQTDSSDFGVLNELIPTRIAADVQSSPDVTLATSSLLPSIHWTAEVALTSDHLPITITISRTLEKINAEKKTYINFNKANWQGFLDFTETYFEKTTFPQTIAEAEKKFRNILNKAKARYIPAGCIHTKNYPQLSHGSCRTSK